MRKTVLVVEDDYDTQRPMAELLQLKGYNAITASDAERALVMARERRPDLIITDIVLPGKSGLHFISTVRSEEEIKSTPILVISGCGAMVLVEAEAAGADWCMEKPIHIENFLSAIEHVLGNARLEEESGYVESGDDTAQRIAREIDDLVEELRHTCSKDQKNDLLKRLKERIRKLQSLHSNYV